MKRTDLIALADELECLEREQADIVARNTIHAMVQFARQIAESQSVAWRFEVRFCEPNPVSEWSHYNTTTSHEAALRSVSRCYGGIEGRAVPLYPLPLED